MNNDIISLGSEESDIETDSIGDTASDIFYIYRPTDSYRDSFWYSGKKARPGSDTNSISYTKHTNLDTKALTFGEKVHLQRVHYLTIGNACRLFLILLCFAWFLFNAYTVFHDYLKFETVVYMEYRSPKYTLPPAISICTENFLGKIPVERMRSIKVYDVFDEKKFKNLFQRDSDNIQCYLTYATVGDAANQVINCSDLVPVLFSIEEGRKCWTYFSDVYGQMAKMNRTTNGTFQFDFESFPSIRLIIFGGPLTEVGNSLLKRDRLNSDMAKEMSTTGLLLALHDPTQVHYMHDLPMHSIPPGKYLDSQFNKKIEDSNENSGCYQYYGFNENNPDYNNLLHQDLQNSDRILKQNHLSEYRSRGECFIYCISRLLNHEKCVNIYSILTKEVIEREFLVQNLNDKTLRPNTIDFAHPKQSFCNNWNDSLSQYLQVKHFCLDVCPFACSAESYDFDTNFITDNYDENITVIEIQWSPEPITFISHRVKFDNPELIGNIGGHAHIWLGVSVIHVVRYIISLIRNRHFVGMGNGSPFRRWLSNICRT